MDTYTLPEYGTVRRIWRAIYPTLMFVLVSLIVGIIYGVIAVTVQAVQLQITDPAVITEMSMAYAAENAMQISLAGQIGALAIFGPMWFATKKKYRRWNGGKLDVVTVLLLIATGIGAYFFISFLLGLTGLNKAIESYEAVEQNLTSGSTLMQFFVLGIGAPLTEELCFRGVTLNRMSNTKLWIAIAVQAVLFGLAHMNLLQGLYAAALGLLLGYLYTQFRTLWVPLIVHAVLNLTQVAMTALAGLAELSEDAASAAAEMTAGTVVTLVVVMLLALGVLVGCFFALKKRFPAPAVPFEEAAEVAEIGD